MRPVNWGAGQNSFASLINTWLQPGGITLCNCQQAVSTAFLARSETAKAVRNHLAVRTPG
jgi:hypothetical protein